MHDRHVIPAKICFGAILRNCRRLHTQRDTKPLLNSVCVLLASKTRTVQWLPLPCVGSATLAQQEMMQCGPKAGTTWNHKATTWSDFKRFDLACALAPNFENDTLRKIWCYRAALRCLDFLKRRGSIAPNFLKRYPSEYLMLSNRPSPS